MEKQTRINKYKELRDEMKEEVAIDRQIPQTTVDENDDFLSFIPEQHEPNIEDTLGEPLSYENVRAQNDNVQSAIREAKENVGKDQYNTRLDILNKIKGEDVVQPEVEEPTVEKKQSLLEKLASLSPQEDAEELKKYEESVTVEDIMSEPEDEDEEDEEDDFSQEPTLMEKILNYAIIILLIVFVVLVFIFVKETFF